MGQIRDFKAQIDIVAQRGRPGIHIQEAADSSKSLCLKHHARMNLKIFLIVSVKLNYKSIRIKEIVTNNQFISLLFLLIIILGEV